MLDIVLYGDPVLRKQAKKVELFDAGLLTFTQEMVESMTTADGVGLAANQVGQAIAVAVVDASGGKEPPLVLINPEITAKSDEEATSEEGCLSFPDIHVNITRPARVTVQAVSPKNEKIVIENAEGLLSRALQHEIDHLNGIMIIDHISSLQRQLLRPKLKAIKILRES